MHINAIKKIALSLKEIAGKAETPKTGRLSSFHMHDGVVYSLPDESAIQFNKLISKFLKHSDFSSRFSSKFIEKKLKEIFAKLLKDNGMDLEVNLNDLVLFLLSFHDRREVFLPVEGVFLNICFELGRVKFVPGDDFLLVGLREKAWEVIKSTKHSETEKISFEKELLKDFEREFRGRCVAIVEVDAEPERAYDLAKEEVRRAIDLLRYSSKALYPLKEDVRVGLKGDYPKSQRQGFIFSEKGLNTKGDTIGSVISFEIDHDALKQMEGVGVFVLSNALKKKQTSNFEDALIRSVHWFSVALTQDETGNAFLFLIVALESLFKATGNSIAATVAESVALMLSNNLDGRKKLISLMRDFYGKRSAVAHGGNKAISDSDLYSLINITGTIIMISIEKNGEFASQNSFMDWLENIKLS